MKERAAIETTQIEIEVLQNAPKRELHGDSSRRDHQRVAGIVESLPDATMVINQNGHIIAWNRAMEKITGVRAEAIMGKGNYEYALPFYGRRRPMLIDLVLHPDDFAAVKDQYTSIRQSDTLHAAEGYAPGLKGDTGIHFDATASILRDPKGHIIGAIECLRDQTERKRLEEELARSEKQYRDLVDNSPVGIYRSTLEGEIIFSNQALADLLGYDTPEALISADSKAIYCRREDRDTVLAILRRHGKMSNHPIEILTRKGDRRYIIMSAALDRNIISGIFVDVTQHRLALEENQNLQSQLMRAQKMEAMGTLAGGIAHDFNNILMGIRGNTEVALNRLAPGHPNHTRMTRIEELVDSGVRLTQQLLGFARGGKYEIMTIDINALLEKSASLFNRTGKEIAVALDLRKDIWAVEADQGQIEQVFMNIIINAGQAMPGGGNLYLATQNVVLSEADVLPYDVQPGRYVMVSITDTGIGMSEKILERIFDPFFTTKRPGGGTGLGLASAYGIVKNHGGYITVRSSPGHGSTFTIRLPASKKAVAVPGKAPEEVMTGGETILVVDDEKHVAAVTKEILEDLGYRVFTVGSGQEAVSVYMEYGKQIALIVLDMIMPGMSGEKTFEALRDINPGVKVILASGYSLDDQTRRVLALGCQGFIQKPFRIHEISRKVREVLDGKA